MGIDTFTITHLGSDILAYATESPKSLYPRCPDENWLIPETYQEFLVKGKSLTFHDNR